MTEFNEAPASVTIRAYAPNGFDVLLTFRDSDTSRLFERLSGALPWLEQQGYKPTKGGAGNANGAAQGDAPVCEYHGPMKQSTKAPGTWYCPSKMGDGSYCKSKA